MKLLMILFLLKLYARIKIFSYLYDFFVLPYFYQGILHVDK